MSKKKPSNPGDRHKPSRMYRVKAALAEVLELLAKERVTNGTQEVNRAVREMLEREGRWPPPPEPADD